MVNEVYTEMLRCFKILFPRLSENFPFVIYVFIQVSDILLFLPKERKFESKKAPPTKVEGFQISLFGLNQAYKLRFTEDC